MRNSGRSALVLTKGMRLVESIRATRRGGSWQRLMDVRKVISDFACLKILVHTWKLSPQFYLALSPFRIPKRELAFCPS
jgi:hypothetical protein